MIKELVELGGWNMLAQQMRLAGMVTLLAVVQSLWAQGPPPQWGSSDSPVFVGSSDFGDVKAWRLGGTLSIKTDKLTLGAPLTLTIPAKSLAAGGPLVGGITVEVFDYVTPPQGNTTSAVVTRGADSFVVGSIAYLYWKAWLVTNCPGFKAFQIKSFRRTDYITTTNQKGEAKITEVKRSAKDFPADVTKGWESDGYQVAGQVPGIGGDLLAGLGVDSPGPLLDPIDPAKVLPTGQQLEVDFEQTFETFLYCTVSGRDTLVAVVEWGDKQKLFFVSLAAAGGILANTRRVDHYPNTPVILLVGLPADAAGIETDKDDLTKATK